MKTRIWIFSVGFIFCPFISAFSQCNDGYTDKEVIADTTYKVDFKNYEGFIFPKNYHGYIVDKETETFTLSLGEVNQIERILLDQYNDAYLNDTRTSEDYQGEKNLKSFLKKFDRQYLGYIGEKGDRFAKVILARRKGKGKRYFECFDKIMVVGFGEFYEKNQKYFIVDLDKEKLMLP